MKKIYSVLLTLLMLCAVSSKAQVNLYTFSSAPGTYSEISGGTVLGTTANDEEVFNNSTTGGTAPVTGTGFPIGFNFIYNGITFDKFAVASNGYIVLGTGSFAIANTTTTAISSATAGLNHLISVFNQDLQGQAGSELSYLTTGSAPNRSLTVQWKGYKRWNGTDPMNYNFQIILREGSNLIEYSYGTVTTVSSYTAQIGIKGAANTDYANRTTTTDWSATTAGATNTATVSLSATVFPASGLRYTFTPPVFCATPTSLAASVSGTPSPVSVAGTFTDAPSVPSGGYVVVRTATNVAPVLVNGTTYAVGSNAVGFIEYNAATAGGWTSNGLTPATTYYYWVFSYNGGSCPGGPTYSTSAATTSVTTSPAGNIASTPTGGLWSQTSTWSSGVVPTLGDNVTITAGSTVTIDIAASAQSLTVAGTLDYEAATARTLTVGGNVTVSAGGVFNTAASGTVTTHGLSLSGNITNNGTLDFAIGTAGTGITFTGTANSSFTGTGATTDLYALSLSKGARANEVELNLSNFSVRDLNAAATGALLTSNTGTGTLKISGTNTFSGTLWSAAGYTIPATLGFWLNNPNFTVNGLTGSPTVAGLFRVSQGTYNIGTAAGNSMGFSTGSIITVEGGAVNATGRFGVATSTNVITYTQTAGTIIVGTVGNTSTTLASFDLGTSATSTISMTGGTIILPLASTAASGPRDYRNQAGSGITAVTGGTLQVGSAASGAAKTFNITGVVPNLVLDNSSAGHTTVFGTVATYNHITLNVTIGTGCTLNLSNNPFLFYGTTFTNNGTLIHNGASSRFITFRPATNQTYTGTGVVTAPMTSFELQNDNNFTFDPSVSNVVVSRVIIFSGNIVNANKLTLGNGGATTATVQIGNTTTPTAGGVFDVAPVFNIGTGGQNISYLRTTNPKTTGPEVNTARALNNLTVDDNVNALTIAGGPLSVAGTLALTNGVVNTTIANLLSLGSATAAGTLTGGSSLSYVNGPFARTFPASRTATGTYTVATLLPVGKAGTYLPAYVDPTTTAGGAVIFGAEAFTVNAGTPGTGVTGLSQNRWNLGVSSGAANLTSSFVRIGDAAITASNSILQAPTSDGVYDGLAVGSNYAAGTPNTLTSGSAIPAGSYTGYFAYGNFVPACVVPTTVSAGTITTTGADISFICTSCTGSYIVEYGLPGFTPGLAGTAGTGGTIQTGSGSPITIGGLTPGTTYQVYVRQNCGSGSYSTNSTVISFPTACAVLNVPYTQNFDGVTAPAVPNCITVANVNGDAYQWITSITKAASAPNSMYVRYNSAAPMNDWFFTPGINLTGGTVYRITYSYATGGFAENLRVRYGTAPDAASMTTTLSTHAGVTNTAYVTVPVDFTPASTGVYYFGFEGYSATDQFYIVVDDINIDLAPACPAPINVTVGTVTSTGATVTWPGTGTFIVEYGPTGFTPGTGATAGAGGTVINPATSPQAIAGLTASTAYQVYVRQDCTGSSSGYSANSTVVAFTTLAAPPINDECGAAITIGTVPVAGTTVAATQTLPPSNCSGGTSTTAFDSWFQFTATQNGSAVIVVNNNTMDLVVEVFTGACGGALTSFACIDDAASGPETLPLSGLVGGQTYLVRVYGWNGTRGTFDISISGAALPVTIEYFRGTKQNSKNVLDWKVACYNSPTVTLTLERSADGRRYEAIRTTTETAARCLQPFNYNDLTPLAGINYYRLKSVDADGKVSYSNVVALLNKDKGFEIVSLAPNPVRDEAILSVTSADKTIMEIVVSDLNGKQISKQRLSLIAGNNQVPLNLRNVAAGTYQVTGLTADGQMKSLRFVKQ